MKSLGSAILAGHWPTVVGAWLHFQVSCMIWVLIGTLGVFIAEDFGLNASEKGFLVALPLLGGAVLRIFVGVCTDRFGPKSTGIILLLGAALALLWGWLGATSFIQMLGVGLLLGLAGASFAVALPLAGQAYPPAHQGLAMGLAAAGNSGVVIAAFLAPRLAEIVGWHGVFGIMTIPVMVTAIAFFSLVRSDGATTRPEVGFVALLGEGVRQGSMYWLCLLYGVTFGGFIGLTSFLPIFFHDEYGVNPVTAGTLTAVCTLAGSVIRPLGGFIADRKGGLGILRMLFPAIVFLVLVIAQLPSLALTAPLMFMVLTIMGFGNGVVFQIVSDHFRRQIGMASGLIGAAGGVGGFFLPSLLGVLKDVTGTYGAGFLVLSGVTVLAWVSVEVASRRRRVALTQGL